MSGDNQIPGWGNENKNFTKKDQDDNKQYKPDKVQKKASLLKKIGITFAGILIIGFIIAKVYLVIYFLKEHSGAIWTYPLYVASGVVFLLLLYALLRLFGLIKK